MDYKYWLNKGIKETNEGKFDDALHSLNRAVGLNQDDALAHFSLAIVYHNMNELSSAYAHYSRAIDCNDKMTDAYFNRAQVILAEEKMDDEKLKLALKDFQKAVELDKNFVDALYYCAVVQKKLKDYKGALENLDKVLEIEPQAVYSRALKKLILQKYIN
jgi:tetratricopeptide (TPR) repeat protein